MAQQAINTQTNRAMASGHDVPLRPKKVLRISELILRTGLSRSTIYSKLDPGSAAFDPTFPKQIKLGSRAVAWLEDEVDAWLCQQAGQRH